MQLTKGEKDGASLRYGSHHSGREPLPRCFQPQGKFEDTIDIGQGRNSSLPRRSCTNDFWTIRIHNAKEMEIPVQSKRSSGYLFRIEQFVLMFMMMMMSAKPHSEGGIPVVKATTGRNSPVTSRQAKTVPLVRKRQLS